MITFPHAKINLGLHVVARREDGFHDIETILYPIALKDMLEVVVSPDRDFRFSASGIPGGNKEDNLCVRAFRLIEQQYGIPPVHMHLHKTIPVGAGLGGGSADAAYTLLMLNEIFKIAINAEAMHDLAVQLGSDCPFFLQKKPLLALGKGDQFQDIDFSTDSLNLLLVKPKVSVSTAQAYQWVEPAEPSFDLRHLPTLPIDDWKSHLRNDFECPVAKHLPELKEVPEILYKSGAVYASMSGSGSSFFALYRNEIPDLKPYFPACFLWSASL